jgi:V-type H+-transporting ATPase subunit D
MKLKLKGAQTGHSLLKRKSEALTKRFREIVGKIGEVIIIPFHLKKSFYTNFAILFIQAKLKMGKIMQNASFSLAEVTYTTGDIR